MRISSKIVSIFPIISNITFCKLSNKYHTLFIHNNELINEKYNNPLNLNLDFYFPDKIRAFEDDICKNEIVVHTINNFLDIYLIIYKILN